jgi:hypothetical protein
MDTSIGNISNLSTPVKVGAAVLAGGGLLGIVAALTGGNPQVLLIVTAGIAFVALLLVAYKFILGWIRKRKAAPLEKGILNNSSVSPNAISEPARRARLDDLRRSFEGGVEKFKASGKNIYSLPWYALVGEPGSGKTEAIRHCNVGFPPGLQDQLQGAGGTLNMNWWFTNHAIILDTAGRLMFEEVEPGGTSEWKEFLTLLTRVRPNCPINGMLLVIPADSLIRDTADSIERKAGKIAQQLDSIQRSLGVRFPVFVVITKCDLINGFREFFDNVTDPQLRDQIVGWSNPAGLDQGFSPELVEKHLESVANQLSRRRQGLLLDPVNTEDPNARRIDQVDALYSFPESLLKIGPRLRKYLETIFVTGEWSPKPLFLRGIYFTSSMREGSALDAELAEALKVPMESLPEGKVWERDRSFFLKDVFVQKVFKEKGLVTRATDTRKLQRRRKMAVLMTGFIGVFLLLGLTYWGSHTLKNSIGAEKDYWVAANEAYNVSTDKWPIVSDSPKPYTYKGDGETKVERVTRGDFHAKTYEMLQTPIDVPWVFKPLSLFSPEINETRNSAYRAMYERSVLRPLVDAARAKIRTETEDKWSDRATQALAQLIRIETYAAKTDPATALKNPTEPQAKINLEPIARYVIDNDTEFQAYRDKHGKALQSAAEWLYTKEGGGGEWPPQSINGDGSTNRALAITLGVKTFNEHWSRQVEGRSQRLSAVTTLVESLQKFLQAERDIKIAVATTPETVEVFKGFREQWNTRWATMQQARSSADAAVATLEKDNGWPENKTLGDVFDLEVARIAQDATRAHQALIDHLPADEKAKASQDLTNVRTTLKEGLAKVPALKAKLAADERRIKTIPELDQLYLSKGQDLEKKQSRRYVIHHQVYALADKQMVSAAPPSGVNFSNIANELKNIDAQVETQVGKEVDNLLTGFLVGKEPVQQACDSVRAVADFAAKEKRYKLIDLALKTTPQNAKQVASEIATSDVAKNAPPEALAYRQVPLTAYPKDGSFSLEYYPDAAANYIAGWKAVGGKIAESASKPRGGVLSPTELNSLYDKTNKPVEEYLSLYVGYWRDGLLKDLSIGALPAWDKIFSEALATRQWESRALSSVQAMEEKSYKALEKIRPLLPPAAAQSVVLQAPLSTNDYGLLEERGRLLVNKWRNLGDDAEGARQIVNALPADEFENAFIFPDYEKPRLTERYLADFSFRMLEALALQARQKATEALAKLRQMSRFPLAKPVKGGGVLSQKEIAEARNYINRIKVAEAKPAAGRVAAIRPGAAGREVDVTKYMRMLRGLDLDADQKAFVDRTERLLRAIPEPGKSLRVNIYWLPKETQERYAGNTKTVPWARFGVCEVIQAAVVPKDKGVNERVINNELVKPIAEVVAPGDPIRLRFTPTPTPAADDPVRIWPPINDNEYDTSSPWTLLRLLHGENGVWLEDGKVWHIEVPIEGKESFWLKFEFLEFDPKKSFPAVADWPEKPAR